MSTFKHFAADGIDVYVHPGLEISPEGMEIGLDRWAFMRRLRVSGVRVAA
ncbi:MAG: hypothetical protein Q8P31_13690 [Bacillota bacterium]|nr:hypothetical protein [Bacillota bacterium]